MSASNSSRFAIATFLGEDTLHEAEDFYFIGARILAYQLLHANTTRSSRPIPFLVLINQAVTQDKRDRLTKDGAQVVLAEEVPTAWWIRGGEKRWKDVMTKIRLFEMTDYDRILFIDADTLLTRQIDGVFEETMVREPSRTRFEKGGKAVRGDEDLLPAEYIFASRSDNAFGGKRNHPFPPKTTNSLSAGFFLLAPSQEMYSYLMSVTKHFWRFSPRTPEQSLMNYAFRREGAMPWLEVDYRWTATWPNLKDAEVGVASLHEKFWKSGPKELRLLWRDRREEMEAYYNSTS